MTTPFPTIEVPQPALVQPAVGTLLNTFEPVPTDDPHWELGYHFPTWGSCIDAFRWGPCSGVLRRAGSGSSTVEAVPFTVYAPFRCSTFGTGGELGEYEAAARDALRSSGGQQLEAELWAGALAAQNDWPNQFLAGGSATVVGEGEALPWPVALALLQKALRDCMGDDAGVIHASAALVSLWQMAGAVREVDGVLRDAFGNFVVAGAGYTGGAPVVSQQWSLTPGGTGGTFRLTVTSPITGESEQTAAIAYNASANDVLTALLALTSLDPANVSMTSGPPHLIDFIGAWADQPVAVTLESSVTGGDWTLTESSAGGSVVTWGDEWAYATGMLDVRVGEVVVIDPENGHSIDRTTNTVELIAQATMSAAWDCCHLAVRASISDACTFPALPE